MYEKQMELFQDGGKVDKASGNDIPLGSTAEEVRDDQPAMLSEGEMVIPADVVRYFGVEHFMNLRDQAKMGYKKMEAMGQFGTEEGQTLPDDTIFNAGGPPFTIEDIEVIEDDMQEKQPVKAADGALIATTLPSIAMGMSSLLDSNGTSTDSQASDSDINDPALAEAAVSTDQTQSTVGTNNFNYLLSFMPDTFRKRFETAEGEDKEVVDEVEKFVNTNVQLNVAEQGEGNEPGKNPTTTELGILAGGGSNVTGSIPEMYAVPSQQNIEGLKSWNANLDTAFGRAVLGLSDMFLGSILSGAMVPGPIGAVKMAASLMDPSVAKGFAGLYSIATEQAKDAGIAANAIENYMSSLTPQQQQQLVMLTAAESLGIDPTDPNQEVFSIQTNMGQQIATKATGPLGGYMAMGPYGVMEVVVPDEVLSKLSKEELEETQKIKKGYETAVRSSIESGRLDRGGRPGVGKAFGPEDIGDVGKGFDIGAPPSTATNFGLPDDDDIVADTTPDYGGMTGAGSVLGGTPSGFDYGDDGIADNTGNVSGMEEGFDVSDAMGGDADGGTSSDSVGESMGADGGTDGVGDFKHGGFVHKRKYKKKKKRRGLAGR